ncbi:MAG: glycosyltransferase [Candidatus Taylorbacteria bacterium]|nr:glycosyltransferase [Candidatus Taylorbacteria bacterium]
MDRNSITRYFDEQVSSREYWKKRNWYYHKVVENLVSFLVPPSGSVLEIGSGVGDLLSVLKANHSVGIDLSSKMVEVAKKKHPECEFRVMDAEEMEFSETFDYIVLSDLLGHLADVEKVFHNLKKVSHSKTRVIITYYNYAWEPILRLAETLGLKAKQPLQHWLSEKDIENLLYLAGFEVVKRDKKMLLPFYIPWVTAFTNRIIANLPLINRLCLIQYFVARPIDQGSRSCSVSVIIPARNEKGNIEQALRRMPYLGTECEIIFVEGHSTDATFEEINRVAKLFEKNFKISVLSQEGRGKGDAVRKGFAKASGDILMILDADLTVPPEELGKFYEALCSGKCDFANGSRLIYPMEKEAMRFFNVLGNKFFSLMFSWLLGQRIKDTLCGTKVLFREDYEKIIKGRAYFGDFDPFGDFDLLFGAAKLNLKIMEIPVHYKARTYGTTQIERWKHGWLLLKMCVFAARKLK